MIQKKSLSSNLLKNFGETKSRELGLDYLDSTDMQEVYEKINAHYRLPDPPEVPSSVRLEYGFRSFANFDSKGIFVTKRGKVKKFTWDEVLRVFIIRLEPLRTGFEQVIIFLPYDEIKVISGCNQKSYFWTVNGSTAEEVNEFIFHHVDSEKVFALVLEEEHEYRLLVRKELKAMLKQQRFTRIQFIVGLVVIVFSAVFIHLYFAIFVSFLLIPLQAYTATEIKKRVIHLRDLISGLNGCG